MQQLLPEKVWLSDPSEIKSLGHTTNKQPRLGKKWQLRVRTIYLDWTAEEVMKIIVGQDQLQQWGWNLAQQLPSTFPTRKRPWMLELLLSDSVYIHESV